MMARLRTKWPCSPFVLCSITAVALLAACTREKSPAQTQTPAAPQLPAAGAPKASAPLSPEDGQWVRPIKDYAGLRYSQLAEITTANVKNLKPAWTFSTAVLRGHEEP